MHLADLKSYSEAQQRLGELYRDNNAWTRKTIINIASSGGFSSDRTVPVRGRSGTYHPVRWNKNTVHSDRPGDVEL